MEGGEEAARRRQAILTPGACTRTKLETPKPALSSDHLTVSTVYRSLAPLITLIHTGLGTAHDCASTKRSVLRAMYMLALLSAVVSDLAAPAANDAIQLHAEPNIWLAHGFLSDSSVSHVLSRLPKDESAYTPCIGQVEEYSSKRCTFLPVVGDSVIETVVAKIQAAWKIDTSALTKSGLPVIRYLPGAPPVGVHGDIGANGLVPNATLVLYLTDSEQSSGQTYFPSIGPEGGVQVTPRRGSIPFRMSTDAAIQTQRSGTACVPFRQTPRPTASSCKSRLSILSPRALARAQAMHCIWRMRTLNTSVE